MVERRLIPIQEIEEASLSERQQKELYSIARITYLRGHNISMDNMGILNRAIGVLGDALRRELEAEGRESITPTERLRPLIEKGLILRDRLCQNAREVIDLSLRNETTILEPVGPLALPELSITSAESEVRNYLLTPQLTHTQQLVDASQHRMAIIDGLTKVGLSHLPEELRGVTLDRFPNLTDRAKLVRNMIASFVFRGGLNPLITISDLKGFVQTAEKSYLYFSDEARESLIAALNLSSPAEIAFITDLFGQTREAFSANQHVPSAEDTEAVDRFYRGFSKDLLLLHPALEEEQIIISTGKATVDTLSVWQNAVAAGNFRLPRPEMLAQAIRQAKARGDNIAVERLYKGIKAWKRHNLRVIERVGEIESLETRFAQREALLAKLSDPSFPLPAEAYSLKYSSETAVQEVGMVATSRERVLRKLMGVIEDNSREQEEAKEYEDWLKVTYGDSLPDFLPMPRSIFVQRLRGEVRSSRQAVAQNYAKLGVIEDLLDVDTLFATSSHLALGYLKREGASDWVKKELARVRELGEKIKEKPEDFFHERQEFLKFPSGKALDHLKKRLTNEKLSGALRSYLSFWLKTMGELNRYAHAKPDTKDKYYSNLVQEALKQRVSVLEYAGYILGRLSDATSKAESDQIAYDRFLENPEESMPADAIWSRDDAMEYIAEMKDSELPDLSELSLDDLRENILEMRRLLVFAPTSTFPLTVPTRDNLKVWMNQRIAGIREELAAKKQEPTKIRDVIKLRRQTARLVTKDERKAAAAETREDNKRIKKAVKKKDLLEKQLDFSIQAQRFLDHPLMPSPDEWGMKRDEFLRIWRRRVELADAVCNSEEMQQKSQLARDAYLVLLRNSYTQRVRREVESMQESLRSLKTSDVNEELIKDMKELNLVMEVSDTEE